MTEDSVEGRLGRYGETLEESLTAGSGEPSQSTAAADRGSRWKRPAIGLLAAVTVLLLGLAVRTAVRGDTGRVATGDVDPVTAAEREAGPDVEGSTPPDGRGLEPDVDDSQTAGGPGWRLIASIDSFSAEADPPMGAVNSADIEALEARYGLDLSGVDINNEIVITQMVIKALGVERRCGPHLIDNVSAATGEFSYRLITPERDESTCVDGDRYQLFVLALSRDGLPGVVRLPHRAALIEIDTSAPLPATIVVNQRQTECCYFEGSLGLLEVLDEAGDRAVPLSAAPVEERDGTGFIGHVDEIQVPAGRYTVAFWQYVCPGGPCSSDPVEWERQSQGERADLCVTQVEVQAGRAIDLTATWAPGQGCESFESATTTSVLEINAIDLVWPLREGTDTETLRLGPGRYPQTAKPGEAGNVAIAGHRTTWGAPFNRLDELAVGDTITITADQSTHTYAVIQQADGNPHLIVDPQQTSIILDDNRPLLTLTTHHPDFSARERLIVQAELIGTPTGPSTATATPIAELP